MNPRIALLSVAAFIFVLILGIALLRDQSVEAGGALAVETPVEAPERGGGENGAGRVAGIGQDGGGAQVGRESSGEAEAQGVAADDLETTTSLAVDDVVTTATPGLLARVALMQLADDREGEDLSASDGGTSPTAVGKRPTRRLRDADADQLEVRGTVMTEDGFPLAGSRVVLTDGGGSSSSPRADALTASDGTYVLQARAGAWYLQALAPSGSSLAPSDRVMVTLHPRDARSQVRDFILYAGESIEGLVTDAMARPLEGVTITSLVRGNLVEQVTDRKGEFTIQGIPPDHFVAWIRAEHPAYHTETQETISPMDGLVAFIMRSRSTISLAAVWEFDSTPITSYTYRVVRRTVMGTAGGTGGISARVDRDDGKVELPALAIGSWRAEVLARDPEGRDTSYIGAVDFDVPERADNLELVVRVGGGRVISGTVVTSTAGVVVANAEVKILPPGSDFGRYRPPSTFSWPVVRTDGLGRFAFPPLPPGVYYLQAHAGEMVPDQPARLSIDWGSSRNPEPVQLRVIPGGVAFGQIFGEDGQALVGATVGVQVQNAAADGWTMRAGGATDGEGRFRVERLPAGAHYLSITRGGQSVVFQRFDLAASEEREFLIDLSGRTRVAGYLSLNGEPAAGKVTAFGFRHLATGAFVWAAIQADSTFDVRLMPGAHIPTLHVPSSAQSNVSVGLQGEEFEVIQAEGEVQPRNFDFFVSNPDVVLFFRYADGQPGYFVPGNLAISPPRRSMTYNFQRVKMESELRRLPPMLTGEYAATFISSDRQWLGSTGLMTLGGGANDRFVIEVVALPGPEEAVGNYGPGDLSHTGMRTLSYDVSHVVGGPGSYDAVVLYQQGLHAVEVGGFRLVSGGAVLGSSDEPGWSGTDHWNNLQRLVVTAAPSGAVRLEVRLRSDGGSDSYGRVFLLAR